MFPFSTTRAADREEEKQEDRRRNPKPASSSSLRSIGSGRELNESEVCAILKAEPEYRSMFKNANEYNALIANKDPRINPPLSFPLSMQHPSKVKAAAAAQAAAAATLKKRGNEEDFDNGYESSSSSEREEEEDGEDDEGRPRENKFFPLDRKFAPSSSYHLQ